MEGGSWVRWREGGRESRTWRGRRSGRGERIRAGVGDCRREKAEREEGKERTATLAELGARVEGEEGRTWSKRDSCSAYPSLSARLARSPPRPSNQSAKLTPPSRSSLFPPPPQTSTPASATSATDTAILRSRHPFGFSPSSVPPARRVLLLPLASLARGAGGSPSPLSKKISATLSPPRLGCERRTTSRVLHARSRPTGDANRCSSCFAFWRGYEWRSGQARRARRRRKSGEGR